MKFENLFLRSILFGLLCFLRVEDFPAQNPVNDPYKPLVLALNEDGSHYLRFALWQQFWLTTNNSSQQLHKAFINPSIRRARFLVYGQINPKVLILSHWGLNSLSASNLEAIGNEGDGPQLFLHGAWVQIDALPFLSLGGGLHYWNGLTRMASASTVNFATLDQSRPFLGWHSLGYTSQFGRHMGVFAKGRIGNFDYRISLNDPIRNGFNKSSDASVLTESRASYNAINIFNETKGKKILEGYFRYNFLEKESITLPYNAGTHLGKYRIIHLGAGFFYHPEGSVSLKPGAEPVNALATDPGYLIELNEKVNVHNVFHYAFDAFLDMPVGEGALNMYLALMNFDFGPAYLGQVGAWSGTGSTWYGQVGYLVPQTRIMPYVTIQFRKFDAYANTKEEIGKSFDIGSNYFIHGHNVKLTFEYHNMWFGGNSDTKISPDVHQFRFQAQIFL